MITATAQLLMQDYTRTFQNRKKSVSNYSSGVKFFRDEQVSRSNNTDGIGWKLARLKNYF